MRYRSAWKTRNNMLFCIVAQRLKKKKYRGIIYKIFISLN